jgi:hypothetical protein
MGQETQYRCREFRWLFQAGQMPASRNRVNFRLRDAAVKRLRRGQRRDDVILA